MPLPRKLSPRRRERRSRSRSPRNRRRSRSRSRSRDRRRSRSRSAQRRRSPERKRSPVRRRSPSPRKRSRSPRRRSHSSRRSRSHSPRRRSRSHSPRRRGSPPRRRSTSPADKIYPVKRPADSSVKRQSYRSRSRSESPAPVKKPRDERLYREESPHEKQRPSRRSTSPSYRSPYSGKMYADNPPSSRQPLFPAGTSKRAAAEIDYVTIVEKGPKKEKLNKRFETLEQAARGPFDFEENITIGIHRGPQHIQLDGDEDIEVNYDFNPKTFKMLFPKKDYVKAIFDRDEIKAFHHDDILDEEAYVEKRTISIKPVDKPKSRKYNEEMDYKITVGTGREGYGDRRMVHDSGSRQRPSRSSGYEDIPVTVRLDPKPDPRYEKMYREQQRFEDHALMHEKVNRDPNDLRYNLMRRRSDGDRERGHDSRDAPSGAMDARSRIEARRQESRDYGDKRDRPDVRRGTRVSPQRSADRKKTTFVKTDLPDFKNRPEKFKPEPEWKINPTITPKGQSYYEHDNRSRDDMTFWERKQMFLKTGRYPSFRGGRGGIVRGRGRGRGIDQGFMKKTIGAAMDEWKHDKFDEVSADENNSPSKDKKEEKDIKKDKKGSRKDKDDKNSKRESSSKKGKESSSRKEKESSSKKELESSFRRSSEMAKDQETIRQEEESLQHELKVEVTIGE